MNNKLFYSLSIFILFFNLSFAQSVKYPITNYSKKDYGRGQEASNYAVVQDSRGLLYFGNANGILEFDGIKWNFIPVKKGVWITSLAVDKEGSIYVGSTGEFGYLAPDKVGNLYYISLSDSLKEEDQPFATVLKTLALNDAVIFQTEQNIYIYRDNNIKIINPTTSFHLSFVVNDNFYVRMRGVGLMKLDKDKLVLTSDDQLFKEYGIFAMMPYKNSKNEILVGTMEKGLWILDVSKKTDNLNQLHTSNDELITLIRLYGGIALSDGNYAFNTLSAGILIIDPNGNIVSIIDKRSGLRVNDVKQLIQDRQNNLWLTLQNGLARIDYSSPFSYYSESSGIEGSIQTLIEYNHKLYIGTSNGLYVQQEMKDNLSILEFKPIDLFTQTQQIWSLNSFENFLLIGAEHGLYQVKNDQIEQIFNLNARSLYIDYNNNLIFVGGKQGLAVFEYKDARFSFIKYFEEVFAEIIGIEEYMDRVDDNIELWLGTLNQGAIKIIIDRNLNYEIESYYTNVGLEESYILPHKFGDNLIFASSTGFYEFIDKEAAIKELPDSLKNDTDFHRGYLQSIPLYNVNIVGAVTAFNDCIAKTWLAYEQELGYFDKNKNDTLITRPFLWVDKGKINALYSGDEEICWIGADDGLISFRMNKIKDYDQEFNAYIRKVIVGSDSFLYNGTYYKFIEGNDIAKIDTLQPENLKAILDYKFNSVTFYVSSNYYDKPKNNLYSYKLIGYKDEWSKWSNDTKISFPYLREGDYKFLIRSKNVFDKVSKKDSFEFTILPPWHRTTMALVGYIIFLVAVVFVIIRLSLMRLKRANERLERIVAKRTVEIREERDKSDKLLLNTLPEKVVKELKEKGRTEPESFDNVSVYFSDVVGFTNMSTGLEPKFLINELNDIFTAFDDIMINNHCERIKTIGDAYMAVCGMPEKNEDHARNMLKSSIEIIKYLEERNKENELQWRIRIGVHSGKVVGGVVGVRKYIYDVFGDTINTASRMESNSEPMRINVSKTTYEILKDQYKFSARPPLEVKGKGTMYMYFLEG